MSSPLDVAMPRSWVLAPAVDTYGHDLPIVIGATAGHNAEVPLPLGANMIRVTWDGSTTLTVKRRTNGVDHTEAVIPAGTGRRTTTVELPSRKPGEVLRFMVPKPAAADVARAQCSVMLVHTPPAT